MHRKNPWEPRKGGARSVRNATLVVGGLLIFGDGCRGDGIVAPVARAQALEVAPIVPAPAPEDEVEIEEQESIDPAEVSAEIEKVKKGKRGKALHEHLGGRGFKPRADPKKDLYGQRTRYKHPDRPNVKYTHTIVLQNYEKEGSADAGAIASVTLTTKEQNETQTTTYDFALIAPNGKLENPVELTADDAGQVVEANSWYSCLKTRIAAKCSGACITAASTCWLTTWAGYLQCLAVSCGGCLTLCTACCACDCSWWCRGAVGCCDR